MLTQVESLSVPCGTGTAREWTVYEIGGPDALGTLVAANPRAARALAAARWPGHDAYPVRTADYEALRRKLERRVARNLRPTAYHEAGHAAVGRLWYPIDSVTIRPRPMSSGGRFSPDQDSLGSTVFREDRLHSRGPRWRACVLLAGPLAEGRYLGKAPSERAACSDRSFLDGLCLLYGLDARRIEAWTDRILDVCWPQVEQLAAALVEHRDLSGADVDRLLCPD